MSGWSTAHDPVISGSYVHWLETRFTQDTTGDGELTTRIARARLGDPNAQLEFYDTAARAESFAIRGSRIVYTAQGGGVIEVTDPQWRVPGTRIPSVN